METAICNGRSSIHGDSFYRIEGLSFESTTNFVGDEVSLFEIDFFYNRVFDCSLVYSNDC